MYNISVFIISTVYLEFAKRIDLKLLNIYTFENCDSVRCDEYINQLDYGDYFTMYIYIKSSHTP